MDLIKDLENDLSELVHVATILKDDESAHVLEDALWEKALTAISKGNAYSEDIASIALRTQNVKFSRWCA